MDSDVIRDGDLVLTPGEFGRVVGDASGPMVVVDHNGHCAVYPLAEIEAVVGVSERDAAIAERDRLRRELEALRDEMREWCHGLDTAACHRAVLYGPTIDRLDTILRGEP